MKKSLLFTLSLLIAGVAFGQQTKKKFNYFAIGLHGGWTQFYGDLRQYDFGFTKNKADIANGAGGLFIDYQLNSVIGFRANVMAGTLGGSKYTINPGPQSSGPNQNVEFSSLFIDYTLNTTMNFVNLMYSDRTKDRLFTSYIVGGVGFTSYRSNKYRLKDSPTQAAGTVVGNSSNPTGTRETTKFTTDLIIPVGLGIKFRLSRRFDLGLEYTHRFAPAGERIDATEGGKKGDSYGYFNAFLAIKLGKQTHSKEWVNPFQALNQNMADLQANVDGLAKDADGDGVSDIFDKEENSPADVAVDGSGRALDTDGDGVPDYLDADPFTNKGARVDENGKELDSDNDGVPDSQDIEPNTAPGALVNFQGKTISLEAAGGETKVNVSGGGLPSIYFKVNSSRIDYWSSYDRLAEVAKVMKADKSIRVLVTGSADKTGAEDYNSSLAEKRAQAAVDHLVKIYGFDAGRFQIVSEGETNPLSVADEALNVNRRVDFKVIK